MPPTKPSVLVVDDDARMLRMMESILQLEKYHVIRAIDGRAALDILNRQNPDLILLDIMMPGMDGYAVCKRIREFSQVPIIMVTGKGDDDEKVRCLDAGADDYITKPFSSRELAARTRVALRHTLLWDNRPEPVFSVDGLSIDFARHSVVLRGRELKLTRTAYRLLSCLARHAGRLLTPDQILEKVWGSEYAGEIHLLQVTIARLRQKLEDDARNPQYILTRPGIGYMMPREVQAEDVCFIRESKASVCAANN
ncbi:MAG: response regulator transcription factor [Dehalococcoidia bacterium]|nr:response regulator transcription factor [Dehalococcoidia bacterium]